MILKIILRQSLFVSRPCRYRPYLKAGRTVEPQSIALGNPFLPKMPGWIPEGKLEGKRAACPFWQLSIGLGGYLSAALSRYSFEGCVCNTD